MNDTDKIVMPEKDDTLNSLWRDAIGNLIDLLAESKEEQPDQLNTKPNRFPKYFQHTKEFSLNYSNLKEERKAVWSAFDPETDNEPTYLGCDFGHNLGKYGLQMFKKTGKIKNKYNKPENEWIKKSHNHRKGAKWWRK